MDLIKKFKSISNFFCKNDMPSYFLAFFFHSFFSHVVPFVYTEGKILLVFTDGYCEGIFSWKNSLQFIDRIFMSMCPFIFANFLVVA